MLYRALVDACKWSYAVVGICCHGYNHFFILLEGCLHALGENNYRKLWFNYSPNVICIVSPYMA